MGEFLNRFILVLERIANSVENIEYNLSTIAYKLDAQNSTIATSTSSSTYTLNSTLTEIKDRMNKP